MAEFSKVVITDNGRTLLAKIISGSSDNVEFTKISTSSYIYTDDEQLKSLTELSEIKQTSLISKVTLKDEVAIKVEVAFNNTNLTEGYYMRALGLYAIDPDVGEILYAVTRETSGNCYMPAYNNATVSGAYIQLVTTVGNAENVSLEVDQAAVATIGDIQDLQNQLNAETTKINTNTTQIATLKTTTAPKNHASSATTYGVASTTKYGHVKYGKDSLTACRGDDERLVPVATVLAYTSNRTAYPTGYLLCRGQAVSRTTYSKLFENLGTRYGSGDGSTTFNLPDLQTRVPVGFKSGDSDFGTLGKSGGEATQTLRAMVGNPNGMINQLSFEEVSAPPGHTFTGRRYENLTVANGANTASNAAKVWRTDGAEPTTIQPYVTMDYIIKY